MAASWLTLHVCLLLALIFMGSVGSHYSKKPLRTDYPGQLVAEHFSKLWHEQTGKPLQYVAGDEWIGGNIAYYAVERPSQVSIDDPEARPWIDQKQVGCKGMLVVWRQDRQGDQHIPTAYRKMRGLFSSVGVATFPWKVASDPVHIGWAIKSPEKACK